MDGIRRPFTKYIQGVKMKKALMMIIKDLVAENLELSRLNDLYRDEMARMKDIIESGEHLR